MLTKGQENTDRERLTVAVTLRCGVKRLVAVGANDSVLVVDRVLGCMEGDCEDDKRLDDVAETVGANERERVADSTPERKADS